MNVTDGPPQDVFTQMKASLLCDRFGNSIQVGSWVAYPCRVAKASSEALKNLAISGCYVQAGEITELRGGVATIRSIGNAEGKYRYLSRRRVGTIIKIDRPHT